MDVEKITKINALAKELKKHGIVDSFDEGAELAQEIIEKNEKSYQEFQNQLKRSVEKRVEETQKQDFLENEINKIKQHLTTLTNKMNEIIDEINKLNDKVDKVMSGSARTQQIVSDNSKIKETTNNKKEEKTSYPRSGNYKPEDVSIEKFFYCGKKNNNK